MTSRRTLSRRRLRRCLRAPVITMADVNASVSNAWLSTDLENTAARGKRTRYYNRVPPPRVRYILSSLYRFAPIYLSPVEDVYRACLRPSVSVTTHGNVQFLLYAYDECRRRPVVYSFCESHNNNYRSQTRVRNKKKKNLVSTIRTRETEVLTFFFFYFLIASVRSMFISFFFKKKKRIYVSCNSIFKTIRPRLSPLFLLFLIAIYTTSFLPSRPSPR